MSLHQPPFSWKPSWRLQPGQLPQPRQLPKIFNYAINIPHSTFSPKTPPSASSYTPSPSKPRHSKARGKAASASQSQEMEEEEEEEQQEDGALKKGYVFMKRPLTKVDTHHMVLQEEWLGEDPPEPLFVLK
jgi:hypothetical protein